MDNGKMNNEQTTDDELLRKIEQLPDKNAYDELYKVYIGTGVHDCDSCSGSCPNPYEFAAVADLKALRQRLADAEAVIEHYGDANNWLPRPSGGTVIDWYDNGLHHGYDCANQYFTKYPRNKGGQHEQTEDK